jgi:hypothetical protein
VATLARGTPYTWDDRANRYRNAAGRFVARREIRRALDATLANTGKRMRVNAIALRDGKITLDAWLAEMRASVKDVHLYSAAVAKGGWAQMTPADFGRVGRIVRDQYAYLDRFAADIESGLTLGAGFERRVKMYLESGRRTYYDVVGRVLDELGFDQERSVRHSRDSCFGCIDQAARGWQPRGSMIPIGERDCLSNCLCHAEYRNSATGEVWTDYAG